MADTSTRGEARDAILAALCAWRDAGEADPLVPVYEDETGDGVPDFYGLDTFGRLRVVDGTKVAWTAEGRPYEVKP